MGEKSEKKFSQSPGLSPMSRTPDKPYEDRTARKSTRTTRSSIVAQANQQDHSVNEMKDKSTLSFGKNSGRISKRSSINGINLAKIRTSAYQNMNQ